MKAPPNSGELASATKLRLGTPYTDAAKDQALEALKTTLRQNGYYQASVVPEIEYQPKTEQADVTFWASTWKRARFEQPVITGNPGQSDKAIIRATHWQRLYGLLGWQEATASRVRQGLDNVRHYYDKRDLLESKVTLARMNYEAKTNTVAASIDIQAGPKIVIRVNGARISAGTLQATCPSVSRRVG